VVGVADGDTITVLENRTQHRIRLYGIDAPEGGQDFGNRAKKFVSDLVFGKQVRIVKAGEDSAILKVRFKADPGLVARI